MLTLAVQKSGRLSEKTLELLDKSGIGFESGGTVKLKTISKNFPLTLLFLRDDDIPECVDDEIADAGIVGENIYLEKEKPLLIEEKLGFAKCRLSIAIPKNDPFHSLADLNGKKIATTYPNILKNFLEQNQIESVIHEINGSVEIAPGIGLADAIFDIVSTGSTLLSNGLKEVHTVAQSEAVLIRRKQMNEEKNSLLQKLLFRLRSVNKAKAYKYILLNAPDSAIEEIGKILPGMKSPTVIPLAQKGWSSVHSVIQQDDFWEVIENLKSAGAQGILVIPIEQMII
jgi:ATP phosphoribosyltransferase